MKKTLLLLFVCLFVGISHAQAQVTVKGTVISSENNEPVIGASVLVKGTTNGTITDINVNPEKPDVPLNKNDAFQKVQKRRVQEKR